MAMVDGQDGDKRFRIKTAMHPTRVMGVVAIVGSSGLLIAFVVYAVQDLRAALDRSARTGQLASLGIAIHAYYDANKTMPEGIDDIKPHVSTDTFNAIRDGEIEVVWNAVNFGEANGGSADRLIAWNTTPTANCEHLVLYIDGLVLILGEDEFVKTPKARTKGKAAGKGDLPEKLLK